MMGTNEEFKRELIGKAFIFARKIIRLVDNLPQKRSCWIIADQLLRSATSIGANIIEAQAASSKSDFVNFLNYALKSANETKFWLALLKETVPGQLAVINAHLKEVTELAKILGSTIATLRGKRKL